MPRPRPPGAAAPPGFGPALEARGAVRGTGPLRGTPRQSIQLHGIPKGALKTVTKTVNDTLSSTLGACGDVNRNVMAAPAPLDTPAYRAAREAAYQISRHLLPHSRAYAELWLDGEEVAKIGPSD